MSLEKKLATAQDEAMKIGELAKAAHTQVETIRTTSVKACYQKRPVQMATTACTQKNTLTDCPSSGTAGVWT
jgi:hypothetical protein